MRKNCVKTNSSTQSLKPITDIIQNISNRLGDGWSVSQVDGQDNYWVAEIENVDPFEFTVEAIDEAEGNGSYRAYDYSPDRCCEGTAEEVELWASSRIARWNAINAASKKLNASRSLNSALSREAASRIKNVFKMAQEAVEMPKGFRYTAFRENKAEDMIISTLMYTSEKLKRTQWVVKSALMGEFTDIPAADGREVEEDSWSFIPAYDPENSRVDNLDKIRAADKVFAFTPRFDSRIDPDRQAAYWLVDILNDMLDEILDNPPNRVYEFFLADGLLKKKNLSSMDPNGLMRLIEKGAITGLEALKAKPLLWRRLLERDLVTAEQVLKAQPNQLAWLTIHGYIPVERALKINPGIQRQLERAGVMPDNADITSEDIDTLVNAVADGQLTPQKAWSVNSKVLKPLIEAKLIIPADAYKLEPSILNWMLENHHIGRAEATKLKPRIKQEMDRKGVDWESLDAGKSKRVLCSRVLNAASSLDWSDTGLDFYDLMEDDYEDDDESSDWKLIKEKTYIDDDGFQGTYNWYSDGKRHIFMVDDGEPDPDYADWECETFEEAKEWFDNWEYGSEDNIGGFGDLLSSKKLNCERAGIAYFCCYDDVYKAIFKATYDDEKEEWELQNIYVDEPMEGDDGIENNDGAWVMGEKLDPNDVLLALQQDFESVKQISRQEAMKYVDSLNSSKKLNASSGDDFYVAINSGELILKLTKNKRQWKEEKIYQDEDSDIYFSPTSYMGYLSLTDILSYLKKDFSGNSVEVVSEEEVSSFLGEDEYWDEDLDSSRRLNSRRKVIKDPEVIQTVIDSLPKELGAHTYYASIEAKTNIDETIKYLVQNGWERLTSESDYNSSSIEFTKGEYTIGLSRSDAQSHRRTLISVLEPVETSASKKLNCGYEDANVDNFLTALSLIDSSDSAFDDLEGLAEDVGFDPDDVGGWESWWNKLTYEQRRKAWDFVSYAWEKEMEDLDSAREIKPVDVDTLKKDLWETTLAFMAEWPQGFDADPTGDFPAKDYCAVDVKYTDDGRVRAEVRAEISFENLMNLADRLNPIVQAYDKYAYFDAVTGGVLDAYIEQR